MLRVGPGSPRPPIVSHAEERTRCARTSYRPSVTSTVRSPERSVRSTTLPAAPSSSRVDRAGCPNEFPVPTLMSAYSGRNTASSVALWAPRLPWCATFNTSMSPTSAFSTSCCSTPPSASPVRSASNSPHLARRTTLVSLVSQTRAESSGQSTSRVQRPTRSASDASRRRPPGAPPGIACPGTLADVWYTAPTETTPSSPDIPPEWSSCGWVMTTASSVRMPTRESARLSALSLGPVSTSTAWVRSRTRIASP